ncbi:DoxX family protein [Antrihabitans cavernicola]|nr:DoxX family protein [Spelaeibacter cavernicola]
MITVTTSRVTGRAATVTAVVRILVGVLFVLASIPKFPFAGSAHDSEVAQFISFGFPASSVEAFVLFTGTVELVCAALLIAGFLTRFAAAGLAAVMIGAISTAGLHVGGPLHLGVAPTLLVILLVLVVVGAGSWSIDQRLADRVR